VPSSKASAESGGADNEASGSRPRPFDAADAIELEAMLRTRAEVLSRASSSDPDLVRQAAQTYVELGRFYAESPKRAREAIDAFRHATELDPSSIDAIRGARVLYTKARRYQKALRMLLAEQERTDDVPQRFELHCDEAVLRRRLGDLAGASQAMRLALRLYPENLEIAEELAGSILERARLGHPLEDAEREEAASLFESLARSLRLKPRAAADSEHAAADTVAPPRRLHQTDTSTPPAPESGGSEEAPPSSWPAVVDSHWPRTQSSITAGELARVPSSTVLPPPDPGAAPMLELRAPDPAPAVPQPAPVDVKVGLEASAPPRTSESQRPPGDSLIGRLFEALHTLEFLNDAPSGAEFVMRLVMETLEVEIGIVHLYDINARSFVVASAGGPKADALIELRSPETEPLLEEVMARDKPLLLAEAQGHPLTASGRWALIDCARAILCAPVQQDGRFLGAIEVANPIDGSPFTDDDVNAISYVAERFTRFLEARGILLSADDASAAE